MGGVREELAGEELADEAAGAGYEDLHDECVVGMCEVVMSDGAVVGRRVGDDEAVYTID